MTKETATHNAGSERRGVCAVLGGSGFIGSNLVTALAAAGYSVRSFDRAPPSPALAAACAAVAPGGVEFIVGEATIEFIVGEVTTTATSALRRAISGADVCFHLMSSTIPQTSNEDPVGDIADNVIGSLAVLELCRKESVKKVIYLSSGGAVYGRALYTPIDEAHRTDPLCSYGVSRLAVEKYLRIYHALHDLDYCILRAANPYGPGQNPLSAQGAVGVFLGRIHGGKEIDLWGDGSVVRDFLYIGDLVRALIAAIDHRGAVRLFNIGSGEGCSLNALLEILALTTGARPKIRRRAGRPFDAPVNVLDIRAARSGLNWRPIVDLPTGLRLTWEWLQRTTPRMETEARS
jgi:UDP-glucose 4-epimerase